MSVASPSRPASFAARSWFGDVVLVVFLCVQVLDGAFTYLGITSVGLTEGNPLVARSMAHLGVGPGLTAAKLLAAACALLLHTANFHRVLAALTLLYLLLAILPWSWLLFVVH